MNRSLPAKNLLVALFGLLMLFSNRANASHAMGADLTYQCLGGNTYQITVSFYRDCIGIAAPASPFVTISSASCGQSLGVTCYPRPGTGQEVTPACSSSVTTCNGGSFTGIQEWIYDGIVTLPAQCTDWVFGYSLCCRNAAITTINAASSNTFYIYATLNNLAVQCNSSPTFSNKPVPFLCRGQQYCFNHGAFDSEGDSLVYSLITPKQTASTDVVYHAPYDAYNPLNSSPATTFNPSTGDICLNPQALEVTVMAVLVQEYRNGVLIGSVERDLQLTVMNCANNIPSLSGINGTTDFDITICANSQTCFDIFSTDPDAGQHLTVTWNSGIPGATFTTGSGLHPTGTFCWTPTTADIGRSFTFTVRVADDACPYNGSQIFSYTVNVIGISVNAGPDQDIACSDLATLTAHAAGGSGTYTYLWSNGSTMQSITVGQGTYTVTASDGQCTATDTVVVNMPFTPTAEFTHSASLCLNNPIQFTDQSSTNGGILTNWDWNFGDGTTSTLQNPSHQFSGPGTYDVTLIVQNNLGCIDTVVHQIIIDNPPVSQFTASNSCVNTSVNFTDQTSGNVNTWHWDFGDGQTSTQHNPVHTYNNAGTYTVTLISGDTIGCIDTISHPITIYPLPVASAGADQTVCAGGSVTLTATGGVTYVWNPSGSTGSTVVITPSGTTTVSVTVTDANGCSSSDTVNIVVNPNPGISAGADQFVCNGNSVTLTATGGVSYTWNPGGATGSTIVVNPGSTTNYTVTGTGANGCTSTDVVAVNVGTLPVANAGPDVNICAGGNATLTATGGVSYVWNPVGGTTSSISVNPGSTTTYTVIATDAAGCSASDQVTVNVHALPVVNLQNTFLCAGSTTTLDAGNPGATYQWNTGATTQTISISSGGNFNVIVTDIYGCSTTAAATVTYGTSVTINLANVAFCQGDSVTLDAGYPGMTHVWTPGGQTTQAITIHTPGTYGVTVTDTSGCSGSINVTAVMNNLPSVSFTSTSVCEGNTTNFTDGSTVVGGSVATWSWNFGDGAISTAQNPGHTYSAAGTYTTTLTATSTAGCVSTASNTVTVNPLPVAAFSFNNGCAGASISFTDNSTVTVGFISSYNWNFGDGSTSTAHNPSHTFASAGNYIVSLQVTTAGGCSQTISQTVTIHPIPVAAFSAPAVCLGTGTAFSNSSTISTGSITSSHWDFNDTYTSTQNSPSHTYNAAGTYNVSLITNSNFGCSDTISQAVVVNSIPVISAGADQTICRGTTANLTSTGGASYLWMPGNLTTASISVSPAAATVYTVTGTDNNGCSASDVVNVNVNALPVINAGADQSICTGNGATLTASGAVSYLWSPGGQLTPSINVHPTSGTNYIVTGTDANGCSSSDTVHVTVNSLPNVNAGPDVSICNGSTISINASGAVSYQWNPIGSTAASVLVTPSSNSSYTVIGTDANGCISADTVNVTVNAVPVSVLYPTFVCSGSTTTLDAGNAGASYSWSTGETAQIITVSDSGNYSVVITSPNGCSILSSVHVALGGNISSTPTNTSICSGQTATLNAGNPGCTYSWSTGATSQTISVSTSGNYYVTITDANGCAATMVHHVQVNANPVPSFSSVQPCFGNASVFTNTSSVSGGSIGTTLWHFGDSFTSSATNSSHTYAAVGTYTVTLDVTSTDGCSASTSANVQVFPNPVAAFSSTPACLGNANSYTDLSSVSGGSITGWEWNFGDGNSSQNNTASHTYQAAGSYTASLIVTTNHGCTDTINGTVVVNGLPSPSFTAPDICANGQMQFQNNSVSSYGTIVSYQWNFGNGNTSASTTPSMLYTNAGQYNVTLTATTSLGCQASFNAPVNVNPLPVAAFSTVNTCAGTAPAIVNSTSVGSGSVQNYYWNFGDNSTSGQFEPTHTFNSDGNYTITLIATTLLGCSDTTTQNIAVYPLPQVQFSSIDTCQGNAIAFTNTSTVSSGAIATWNWDFNDGTTSTSPAPSHVYNSPGAYNITLTATTNYGCTAAAAGTLQVFPNPVAAFSASNVCFGDANQLINLSTVDGGISFTSTWDFNDGSTSTLTNPSHNFTTAGSYPVSLTVVTSNGCTAHSNQILSVYNPPVARFLANNACVGLTTQFIDQSTSVDGSIMGWNWEFGDNNTSVEGSPAHLYNSPGTYSVSLVVTSIYGCYDYAIEPVQIYALPNTTLHTTNACSGSPVQFLSSSTGSGHVDYIWNLGNGVLSTDSSFSYTYSAPGSYSVTLTATNSNGCTASQTSSIQVYPNPDANFNVSEVCQNSNSQFINASSISSGTISLYGWNFGDNSTSTQINPQHTFANAGSYPVTLTTVSDQGCISTTNRIAIVNPNPIAAFQGSGSGCGPLFTSFSEMSSIASGSISGYLWNFGDGEVSTDQHPTHTFTQQGSYPVSLTVVSDQGCYASVNGQSNVIVYPQPSADFTADPISTDILSPVVHFENQSNNFVAYQWQFSDGYTTSTELNPVHAFAEVGTYTALLITTNSYGCRDSVLKTIEVRPKSTLFVPNCFTPNNDGKNDVFKPYFTNMSRIQVWVYDRWGLLLKEWDSLDGYWDGYYQGKKCQSDTYVYKIIGLGDDGQQSEWVGRVSIVY